MCGKTKILFLWVALVLGGVFCALLVPATSNATAGTNQQLNFEGKVVNTNGTNIPDGVYNMEFKVYQDGTNNGTGSTLKWTEDFLVAGSTGMPSTGGVTVSGGTFQVNLGSICVLTGGTCGAKTNSAIDFNQQTLWLSFQVGNTTSCTVTSGTTSFNTGCSGDGEMTPYIRLTAVPQAINALQVGGFTAAQLVQLTPGSQQIGSINVSSNVTTGGQLQGNTLDAATSGTLTIGGTNATALSVIENTTITSGNTLTVQGGNAVTLGSTTAAGGIVYQDGTVSNRTVTVSSPALTNSYTLSFPVSGNAGLSCLQSTSGSTTTVTALQFGSCSSGGATITLNNLTIGGVQINTDLTFAQGANRNLNISQVTSGVGNNLTLAAGQGATTGNQTGGNLVLLPGAGGGTGTTGSVIIKPNGTDSTTFLQIQNAAGTTTIVNLDTTSKILTVNNGTSNFFTADGSATRVSIGASAGCSGRLCVNQSLTTNSNAISNMVNIVSLSSTATTNTIQGQVITLNDTSSGTNTLKPLVVDSTGTSDTASTINAITVNTPATNPGNLIQLQVAGVNLFTVANSGRVSIGSPGTSGNLNILPTGNINNVGVLDTTKAGLIIADSSIGPGLVFDSNQIEQMGSSDSISINFDTVSPLSLNNGGGDVIIGAAAGSAIATFDVRGTTNIQYTKTGATGGNQIVANYTVTPSSAPSSSALYVGVSSTITGTGANLNSNTLLDAFAGNAIASPGIGITVGNATGVAGTATNNGAGTLAGASGGTFNVQNTSSGSITIATTLQAASPTVSAGSIATLYGLYVSGQKVSGVTTGYGIYQAGTTDLNKLFGSTSIFNTSTTAFQIQNGSGTGNVLVADTSNTRVGIGMAPTNSFTLEVHGATPTQISDSATSGYVTLNPNDGVIELGSGNNASSDLDFKGSSHLATDYQGRIDYNDGSGFTFFTNASTSGAEAIDLTGNTFFQAGSASSTAFQIQDHSNNSVFNVDTTGDQINVNNNSSGSTVGSDLFVYGTGTCTGTGWTTGTGNKGPFVHTSGTTALTCTPPASVTIGTTYLVTFTVSGMTNNNNDAVTPNIGGTGNIAPGAYGSGTYSVAITAISTTGLIFTTTTAWTGTITNISVQTMTITKPTLSVASTVASGDAIEVRASTNNQVNEFIGYQAGQYTTTAAGNTALGFETLMSNVTGLNNTAIGVTSLQSNGSGQSNTALGSQALQYNNIGSNNTAVGYNTLVGNYDGSGNTAIGTGSGVYNAGGSNNSYLGFNSGTADADNFTNMFNLSNSTTIGANAVVQQSNSLILGSIGTSGSTKVGIGTTIPLNTFSVSPIDISGTGSATTGGVVTATVGTFTNAMVGEELIFANGVAGQITTFTNGTTVTITPHPSPAVTSQAFRVQKTGFQVKSTGDAFIQNTSATAFQVQNAAGTSLLTVNTSTNQVSIVAPAVPTVDLVAISNAGKPVTTGSVNGLSINYVGGAAAVQASGEHIDLTPGTTSGGTWNGIRILANGTGAVSGVTESGLKLDGPTTPGAGNEYGITIGSGWDAGLNITTATTDPPTPAAGTLDVYARKVSGRTMLAGEGSSGVNYTYQPSLFEQSIFLCTLTTTTTLVGQGGPCTAVTTTTTALTTTEATGIGINYKTAATAGTNVGVWQAVSNYFRGSVTNGSNGFFYFTRFYTSDASYGSGATGARFFAGLSDQTTSTTMTNADNPAGNYAGVQFSTNRADTNWMCVTKDGTTQATPVSTGVTFTALKQYDIYVYTPPKGTSVFMRVDNNTDGTTGECTMSANLPTATTALRPELFMQTLTTTIRGIDFQRMYVETDR